MDGERHIAVARLAHDQAILGLSGQQTALAALQQRATTNIAIVALAATFLGFDYLRELATDSYQPIVLVIAVLAFLSSIVLSIDVLRPRRGWSFHQSAKHIFGDYIDKNESMALVDVYRNHCQFLEEDFLANECKLKKLNLNIQIAYGATVLHIIVAVVLSILPMGEDAMSKPEQAPQQQPAQQPQQPVSNPGVKVDRSDRPVERPAPTIKPRD